MKAPRSLGKPVSKTTLVLGAGAQTGLSYLSFRYPRHFWPLMTVGLTGSGVPGLRRLREHPGKVTRRWLALGLLTGLAGYGATRAGASLAGRFALGRRSLRRFEQCSHSVARPLAALLVIPAAAGEEIFWRESVLGRQRQNGGSDFRILAASTMTYAAVQAGSLQPLPPLGALLLGSAAGWLRIRSGSIWPSVAAHLVYSELCLVAPGLPEADWAARKVVKRKDTNVTLP